MRRVKVRFATWGAVALLAGTALAQDVPGVTKDTIAIGSFGALTGPGYLYGKLVMNGVDVVFDSVGQSTFEKGLDCLAPRGMMALFGQSSGVVPPFSPSLLAKASLFLTRPTLFHYIADRASLEWRSGDVLGQVGSGQLAVRIGRTFPLAEAAEAHRALEGRQTTGKVLLIP